MNFIIIITTYFKRITISVIKIKLLPTCVLAKISHKIDRNMQEKAWVGEIEAPETGLKRFVMGFLKTIEPST